MGRRSGSILGTMHRETSKPTERLGRLDRRPVMPRSRAPAAPSALVPDAPPSVPTVTPRSRTATRPIRPPRPGSAGGWRPAVLSPG